MLPSPIQPAQLERNYNYFLAKLRDLSPVFADRAALHDSETKLVAENVAELQQVGFLAAAIPTELGGSGLDYSDLCHLVKMLAQYCPSTALTVAIHHQLVAATVFNYLQGHADATLLRRVVDGAVLVSTGERDWLESSGTLKRVKGGYLLSAYKPFANSAQLSLSNGPTDTVFITNLQVVLHSGSSLLSNPHTTTTSPSYTSGSSHTSSY
ncbi:MAG: acyl-CoA dehydrogenase family protein [Deinococcota bacterium]